MNSQKKAILSKKKHTMNDNKVKTIKIISDSEITTIDKINDFDNLQTTIARRFKLPLNSFTVTYKDKEGDSNSIRSNSEYRIALNSCDTEKLILLITKNQFIEPNGVNKAKELLNQLLEGLNKNPDELLNILSDLNFNETKDLNKMLWDGPFDNERKKRLLVLFQTLIVKSKLFEPMVKSDIGIPSLYTNVIDTNTKKEFFGSEIILKQIVSTLQARLDYIASANMREWFLATVASPGSGKTFLCYHLLKLAMSGQLSSSLRRVLGPPGSPGGLTAHGDKEYEQLLEKLNGKIVGVQVNCNDQQTYHDRETITSERDTCLRMVASYYFDRCSHVHWHLFYQTMCHLMPRRIERIVELILMDWEERTGQSNEEPFFFVCYDENSKLGMADNVIKYLSARNILIEHFEHVGLPENGNLSDLRKIKIINLVTALNPEEFAAADQLKLSRASNRLIKWIILPDLRLYIPKFIPENVIDDKSYFYYQLGLYWTNGNPRQMEKLLSRLNKQASNGTISGMDLMIAIKKISAVELKLSKENAWKFIALVLCRLSVQPTFFVSDPYRVRELFLESFYIAPKPFPLVDLYLTSITIDECVTSKLYLQIFVSNQLEGDENTKISSFIKATLDLEAELKEENWASGAARREPYLANIFGAHLTCWS